MRGLCIHDDMRKEMSCAHDNGKFFISAPPTVPSLMKLSANFKTLPMVSRYHYIIFILYIY
jgi:hypothetical protein